MHSRAHFPSKDFLDIYKKKSGKTLQTLNDYSAAMSKPIVGYIGLGHAGYPMASCLAKKGYTLIIHDADRSPAERFVQEYPECRIADRIGAGDTLGNNPFQECSILITMLPNGTIVRDVLLGENGVATGLKPGEYSAPFICPNCLS